MKKLPPTNLGDVLGWLTLEQAYTWHKKSQSSDYTVEVIGIDPSAKYCGRWVRAVEAKFLQLLTDNDGSTATH